MHSSALPPGGKILRFSVGLTLLFWFGDAVLDYLVNYRKPFVESLFPVPEDMSSRLLAGAFFLFLGWMFSLFVERREREETALREKALEGQEAELALHESESKYRALVESTDDSIYLVDRDYRYLFINRKHLARIGLSEQEVLGQPYERFHSPRQAALFRSRVDEVFTTETSLQYEHRSERDGQYFLQTMSPVANANGVVNAVTVVSKHITDRKRMEEELRSLSLTDELTGLYNRRGFFALAERQLKIAHRDQRRMFMLYADLDNLKMINDTWGHQEGDIALIDVASLLRDTFRESDIIARIGGDEFVALPVGKDEPSAERVAERLLRNLLNFNRASDRRFDLSISVGIPAYDPAHPCSLDRLLALADDLMYREKRRKRPSAYGPEAHQQRFPFEHG